ncbi:MAG: hypothetical protein U0P30_09200 [Vicinamibacterales bacterium]
MLWQGSHVEATTPRTPRRPQQGRVCGDHQKAATKKADCCADHKAMAAMKADCCADHQKVAAKADCCRAQALPADDPAVAIAGLGLRRSSVQRRCRRGLPAVR